MQLIGKITGIHGLKGEVTFSHHLKRNTKFSQWDCLMVELNPESYIPFFIDYIKSTTSDECICKLEEIQNRDEAKLVLNKNIYASINYSIETLTTLTLQQYVGFTIFNGEIEIGVVTDAVESTMNKMFVVNHQGHEVLLPSQQDLIEKIDVKAKTIIMKLPEGLLGINE